ncbi:sensor histidine kinase [Kitasatospora sp. NPDC098652]|uniref:sensor histidine kinase n=1 Tax=Kitasatospora sp. NPDC098652 TaxID=3364095 RepID=UPI0037F5BC63
MKHRVVRVAVLAVAAALALFALPLAIAVKLMFFADERGELERQVLSLAVQAGPRLAADESIDVPMPESGTRLGVYDQALRLTAGTGPSQADEVVRRSVTGNSVVVGQSGGRLVAAVALPVGARTGAVRASAPAGQVWRRVALAWLALAVTALVALTAAVLVARRQARILSAPLEALSEAAQSVTAGDLSARAASCGIAEIDQLAGAQNTMVTRLSRTLQREREFSQNASHQLRTPLAGLQLGLEAALAHRSSVLRSDLEQALERSRHLQATVDEVLRMTRPGPSAPHAAALVPAADVLGALEGRWHGVLARGGRRLRVAVQEGGEGLRLPGATAAQILDVLLDNARTHGRGTVTVILREIGGATAVDVADEGALALDPGEVFRRGATTGAGHGIGLALARELAETAGGRLHVTGSAPTTFTLLLPAG